MVNEFSVDMLTKESNQIDILLQKCSEVLTTDRKPIVLFGSGFIGRYYLDLIKKMDMVVEVYFCDNNPNKWGTSIDDVLVISFDELKNNYRSSYIIITSLQFYDEIRLQLKENNLKILLDESIYSVITDDYDVLQVYKDYHKLICENIEKFSTIYNLLSDDYSKRLFCDRLNYIISANSRYITPLRSKSPQYFEPEIISLSNEEIFIDGGGYIGDTVQEFIKQTNEQYTKVYSFEPEESKHWIFLKNFSSTNKIKLVPYGLWDKKEEINFSSRDDMASGISETGNTIIPVTSIDEFLGGDPVTFIKMDIEGAEFKALKGAEKTIRKYKPKLAICVYHKPLDIVEIPMYLKELVPEYKFYLRHYNYGLTETVCYAVVE
ncbi:FkbM family methyltransferase [Paenibacillus sp. FSL R7-0273]|uniref:FkbM family methyltransferase n=1 Tax=Paenibacillus sp. FSL R7-0273 TaxID=1536772 RepID=UPI0006948BBD|nr:FkbM family methyltransferase [Paenibacillus sp. FSL R7-0273]OMF90241.1 hypothetical protein BK144_17730 [Paenibacillus sp. FSL R7-0273]